MQVCAAYVRPDPANPQGVHLPDGTHISYLREPRHASLAAAVEAAPLVFLDSTFKRGAWDHYLRVVDHPQHEEYQECYNQQFEAGFCTETQSQSQSQSQPQTSSCHSQSQGPQPLGLGDGTEVKGGRHECLDEQQRDAPPDLNGPPVPTATAPVSVDHSVPLQGMALHQLRLLQLPWATGAPLTAAAQPGAAAAAAQDQAAAHAAPLAQNPTELLRMPAQLSMRQATTQPTTQAVAVGAAVRAAAQGPVCGGQAGETVATQGTQNDSALQRQWAEQVQQQAHAHGSACQEEGCRGASCEQQGQEEEDEVGSGPQEGSLQQQGSQGAPGSPPPAALLPALASAHDAPPRKRNHRTMARWDERSTGQEGGEQQQEGESNGGEGPCKRQRQLPQPWHAGGAAQDLGVQHGGMQPGAGEEEEEGVGGFECLSKPGGVRGQASNAPTDKARMGRVEAGAGVPATLDGAAGAEDVDVQQRAPFISIPAQPQDTPLPGGWGTRGLFPTQQQLPTQEEHQSLGGTQQPPIYTQAPPDMNMDCSQDPGCCNPDAACGLVPEGSPAGAPAADCGAACPSTSDMQRVHATQTPQPPPAPGPAAGRIKAGKRKPQPAKAQFPSVEQLQGPHPAQGPCDAGQAGEPHALGHQPQRQQHSRHRKGRVADEEESEGSDGAGSQSGDNVVGLMAAAPATAPRGMPPAAVRPERQQKVAVLQGQPPSEQPRARAGDCGARTQAWATPQPSCVLANGSYQLPGCNPYVCGFSTGGVDQEHSPELQLRQKLQELHSHLTADIPPAVLQLLMHTRTALVAQLQTLFLAAPIRTLRFVSNQADLLDPISFLAAARGHTQHAMYQAPLPSSGPAADWMNVHADQELKRQADMPLFFEDMMAASTQQIYNMTAFNQLAAWQLLDQLRHAYISSLPLPPLPRRTEDFSALPPEHRAVYEQEVCKRQQQMIQEERGRIRRQIAETQMQLEQLLQGQRQGCTVPGSGPEPAAQGECGV